MSDELVQILEGNTFVVSDDRGDINASLTDPTGLFSFDTRFLSQWVLTVNGQRLNALSTDDLQYFATRFFLVPGTGTVYVDAKTLHCPPCGDHEMPASRSRTLAARYSIQNLGIEESYGFGVLNEGQAIAVAKNVKGRQNEMSTPARPIISVGPDNTNFQMPSGLVGAAPFDVNNDNYELNTVSLLPGVFSRA